MRLNHKNTNNSPLTYQNTTQQGQNLFIVGGGGDGNVNKSVYQSGNNKYYNAGTQGVCLQIYIDDVLVENIAGGSGSLSSLYDQYIYVRTNTWSESYRCGFLKLKTCRRTKSQDIWEWGHKIKAATRAQAGQVKSFVLNLPPNATLKVAFSGSSESKNKGYISISLLESTQPLPLSPKEEQTEQESPNPSEESKEEVEN